MSWRPRTARRRDPGRAGRRDAEAHRRRTGRRRPSIGSASPRPRRPRASGAAILRAGVLRVPGRRPRDVDRRSRAARGLYHRRPCRSRRSRQPQGDRARRSRPGATALAGAGASTAPDGDRARQPPVRAGLAARARRDRHRRRAARSTATPTATSRSTRSPTRCSARPDSATSVGSSRPDRRRPRGHRQRRPARRGPPAGRGAGWRPAGVDVTIVAARPRLGGHLDAMRDAIADLLGLDAEAVNVKASTGNLDGAGRRRPVDLAMADRDARGGGDELRLPRHAHRRDPAVRAAARRRRRHLLVRPDRLRAGPHRQLPLVPVRRPARPPPALARATRSRGS